METAVELLLGMVEEGAPVGGKGFCEAGTEAGGAPFLQRDKTRDKMKG